MKYGLKENQDSPPTPPDTISASENSTTENKIEVVVEVKTIENESESTIIVTQTDRSNEAVVELDKTSVPLPINETLNIEPITVTVNPIIAVDKSEIYESLNVPTPVAIHTDIRDIPESYIQQTVVMDHQQTNSETSPMVLDVTTSDVAKLQELVMEVAISNDEDNLEVDMESKSPTPNDIDMVGTVDGQVDAFVRSTVNYNLKNAPIVELSRYSWGANEHKYLRGCIFSPDGTCILTTVNTDGMHIIELPLSLYENESASADRSLDILTTAVHVNCFCISHKHTPQSNI